MKKQQQYGNDSISALKGAERVRKRPAVIFGSDGLEGCEHAVFEILSNAIDEAREGYGDLITVRRFRDCSIEVEDFGCGIADVAQAMTPFYTSQPDQERTGMGFSLMLSFMDGVHVTSAPGSGTLVKMTKLLHEEDVDAV